MKQTIALMVCLTASAGLVSSCAASGGTSSTGPGKTGSLNVVQAGAQDFAFFRSIVEQGEIPSPGTLDPVGFFAEYAIDLPPADCGQEICIHPMLAVAPRFDNSNWTMAFVAMNTPIDPASLEHPPLHFVVAIERSAWLQTNISAFKSGLTGEDGIAANLRPEDRISLVFMGTSAETPIHAAPVNLDVLNAAIDQEMNAAPSIDLYDGLAEAVRALDTASGFDARRIVVITSGRADAGITDPDHIIELGEAVASEGIALGIIGFGDTYNAQIPAALGSLGAGTYSYAEDGEDLKEVLRLEGETALFPLATKLNLTVKPSTGYHVGRIYGVKRAFLENGDVTLNLPALFIGQREGAKDVGGGRRGGGGGLFVELRVDAAEAANISTDAPAFEMSASWIGSDGMPASATRAIVNPLKPGQNPADMWPQLSDPERGKPFMMLNMYLAFRASVEFYAAGDCARAMGVIDMMAPSVEGWQGKYADPNIDEDYLLMRMLRENLSAHCTSEQPIQPIDAHESYGGCMFL